MSAATLPSGSVSSRASEVAPASRLTEIDLIKGLAIIAVIVLHTVSSHIIYQTGAVFHIVQAVPVFICLMGFNGMSSQRRKGISSLSGLYSRRYFAARFDRVIVPFILAFACAALVAGLTHSSHYDMFMFVGELPIDGPGNYFISLVFQYVLLMPLLFWGLRRWRMRTLLLCLAINMVFEIIAPRMLFIQDHPYLYNVSAFRFLFLVALGAAVATVSPSDLFRSWWLWLGALVGIGYMVLVYTDVQAIPFAEQAYRSQALAAAFYPLLIVVCGMRLLPSVARGPITRGIAELGRASYHIFLVQIIWFGAITQATLLANLVGTMTIGLIFYRFTEWAPLPSAVKLFDGKLQSSTAPQRVSDEHARLAALSAPE